MYGNQFSIDLKVHIINLDKSGNSLKPFQSSHSPKSRSAVQTVVCKNKVHGTVVSPLRNKVICSWAKIGQDLKESTKNHQQKASQQ